MSIDIHCGLHRGTATVHLAGELDSDAALGLRSALSMLDSEPVARMVLDVGGLRSISATGARALVMAQQRLPADADVIVLDARPEVSETLALAGFGGAATMSQRVS